MIFYRATVYLPDHNKIVLPVVGFDHDDAKNEARIACAEDNLEWDNIELEEVTH